MKWLRATLVGAGYSHRGTLEAALAVTALSAAVGWVAFELMGISALALSASVGVAGLLLGALSSRARSRRQALAALWPEVIDSIISSVSSGSTITESLIELEETGPVALRSYFLTFRTDIERGFGLNQSLEALKARLGHLHSDRLLELLILVSEAGGAGLIESLRSQVQLVRQDLAFSGEISSRLGWITGTAKMAVGAPWLIVAMLATRSENAQAYSSPAGTSILVLGLGVSIVAFRLVHALGALEDSPRVFA